MGTDHQSNGRNVPASRRWNRLFAQIVIDGHNRMFNEYRPWLWLRENSKTFPSDPAGDNNPDITDFLDYGHLRAVLPTGQHIVTFLFRDNLISKQKAALLPNWSFPGVRKIRG